MYCILDFFMIFMKGFCAFNAKTVRTLCMLAMFCGMFALPTTVLAYSGGTVYDCGNGGEFPMSFAGCRAGYYYEDWQNADSSLHPDEVGECIECPSGYTCAGGFAGPVAGGMCYANQIDVNGDGDTCIDSKFTITTTPMSDGSTFSFAMSASGTFYVDCGDGGTLSGTGVSGNTITRNNTTNAQYTCTYPTAGTHKILFAGDATGYSAPNQNAAISFSRNKNIKTVDVSLGAIFIGSAEEMFYETFYDCTSLTSIPENLFAGVSGSADYMFNYTFYNCTSLRSIPENLFAGVNGSASDMFAYTFEDCTSLTSIPENLFAGVSGSASDMFRSTFNGCTSLTSLPDGLFKNIEGKPADSMFKQTFYGCTNLAGYIPANTFEKMDSTDFNSATMTDIFNNTALATTCPVGTTQYITGFESAWDGKVACTPCPDGIC